MPRVIAAWVGALAVSLSAGTALAQPIFGPTATTSLGPPRLLLSPPAQRGVPNSWSEVQRTVGMPAAGNLEIAYFVDSEANCDFLTIWVDGFERVKASGPGKSSTLSVPVTAGSHVVRVRYAKDYSVDNGLDRAGILWITRRADGHPAVIDQFRQFGSSAITAGFATSSVGLPSGSEWVVSFPPALASASRPPGHAGLGSLGYATTSSMTRTFQFSAPGQLAFDYYVDTELNWDFLKVWDNGRLAWSGSGRNRVGRAVVPILAGAHEIKFQYWKDGSVDDGGDVVRVDNVVASASGVAFEAHDCNGRLGAVAAGWTREGYAGGFQCERPTPEVTYLPPYVPGGSAPAPSADGIFSKGEYPSEHVVVPDPRALSSQARNVELAFTSEISNNITSVHWAAKIPRPTFTGSYLEGKVVMHAGKDVAQRRNVRGPCATNWSKPSSRDFELTVNYRLYQSGFVEVYDRTARGGECTDPNTWHAVPVGESWFLELTGGAVADTTPMFLLEGRLAAMPGWGSTALSVDWAHTLQTAGSPSSPPISLHAWPYRGEVDSPPNELDTSAWQPVWLLPRPAAGMLPMSEVLARTR